MTTFKSASPIAPKGLFQKEYDYTLVPECFKKLDAAELIAAIDHILDQDGVNISDIKSKMIAVLLQKLLEPMTIIYIIPRHRETARSLMKIFMWLLEHQLYSTQLEMVFDKIVDVKDLDATKMNDINFDLLMETDHVYPDISYEELLSCFYAQRNKVYDGEVIMIKEQSPLVNVEATDPLASALQVDEERFNEMIEKVRNKESELKPKKSTVSKFKTLFNLKVTKEMIMRYLDFENDDNLPIIDHYLKERETLKELKRAKDY